MNPDQIRHMFSKHQGKQQNTSSAVTEMVVLTWFHCSLERVGVWRQSRSAVCDKDTDNNPCQDVLSHTATGSDVTDESSYDLISSSHLIRI